MSENQCFESQTDTQKSAGNEGIAGQLSVAQPYLFEPVADSGYE